MTTASPLVSVLMCVFNGERYVGPAIQSILDQDYNSLEIIVVDDGSTDHTPDVLLGFDDQRLRIVTLPKNVGIPSALNQGLQHCSGKYIARLDSDDLSLPGRISHQVSILEALPEVGVLGGSAVGMINGQLGDAIDVETNFDLGCKLLSGNQLKSSTVMIRRSILATNSLTFDEQFPNAQDYELWCRISQFAKVANESTAVSIYRYHAEQETSRFFARQLTLAVDVQAKLLRSRTSKRNCSLRARAIGWAFLLRHKVLLLRVRVTQRNLPIIKRFQWRNIGL